MNPILALAWRHYETPADDRGLLKEVRTLRRGGALTEHISDAMEKILNPRLPTDYVEVIAKVCCMLCWLEEDGAGEAKVHYDVAHALHLRFNVADLSLAERHYEEFRTRILHVRQGVLSERDKHNVALACMRQGVCACRKAELGEPSEINYRIAVLLSREARKLFPVKNQFFAEACMIEGASRSHLAELGRSAKKNISAAVRLCRYARRLYDRIEPNGNTTAFLVHEGNVLVKAGKKGIEPFGYLRTAIGCFRRACRIVGRDDPRYAGMLSNIAAVRIDLATLGIDARENYTKAIRLLKRVRRALHRDLPQFRVQFGRALGNEGLATHAMADLSKSPLSHLHRSIYLNMRSRDYYEISSPDYGTSLLNESAVHLSFSGAGVAQIDHLLTAIRLCEEAREIFPARSDNYLAALTNECQARLELAKMGVETDANQAKVKESCGIIRDLADTRSVFYGKALMIEGSAWGERGSYTHLLPPEMTLFALRRKYSCYREALESLRSNRLPHWDAMIGLAGSNIDLAKAGFERDERLDEALSLLEQAEGAVPSEGIEWVQIMVMKSKYFKLRGDLLEAFKCITDAVGHFEASRSTISTERERIEFFEGYQKSIRGKIDICLRLYFDDPSAAASAGWLQVAWHSLYSSKSRALFELLREARPRLSEADRAVWEDYERAASAADSRDREVKRLRRTLDDPMKPIPDSLLPFAGQTLAALELEFADLARGLEAKRQHVLDRLDDARALQTVAVPAPPVVLGCLKRLASFDDEVSSGRSQEGSGGSSVHRPLLVDLCLLFDGDLAVFLVPLWGEIPLVAERFRVDLARLALVSASLHEALEGESAPPGRPNGTGGNPSTKIIPANDLFPRLPEELSALVQPWTHLLEELEPTELIISPHSILAPLPLHVALWRGKPLIEWFPISYLPSAALAEEIVRHRKKPRSHALLVGNPTGGLPLAEDEVEYVKNWLDERGVPHRTLVGGEATTSRVMADASSSSVFHFAGHSVLDAHDFLRSGLELADRRMTVADMTAMLDLEKANLVYLNSCESGRSFPGLWSELLALVRVFFYAGSPTIIATLWANHDDAGCAFADHFYKNWLSDGASMAAAFQGAMLSVRERFPNPIYWAPFVLLGSCRENLLF